MNDLLPKSHVKGTNYVILRRETMNDLEMADVTDRNEDFSLKEFFRDAHFIQSDMEKAKQLLSKLRVANEEGKTIYRAEDMKALRERMDRDMIEVTERAKSIKANIEDLDKANLANRNCRGCELGSPVDRTRISMTNALRQKLKRLMEEFQELQHLIMAEYKETVERRLFMVIGQHPDEDTVDQIIKTGESENLLQMAIYEQGRGQLIDTISELKERHNTAKEIEHSLLDLHQVFLDMSLMIDGQGEKLNNIQHNVDEGSTYVECGTQQLKDAKYYQRNSFKYAGLALMILLILIVLLVVSLAVKSTK